MSERRGEDEEYPSCPLLLSRGGNTPHPPCCSSGEEHSSFFFSVVAPKLISKPIPMSLPKPITPRSPLTEETHLRIDEAARVIEVAFTKKPPPRRSIAIEHLFLCTSPTREANPIPPSSATSTVGTPRPLLPPAFCFSAVKNSKIELQNRTPNRNPQLQIEIPIFLFAFRAAVECLLPLLTSRSTVNAAEASSSPLGSKPKRKPPPLSREFLCAAIPIRLSSSLAASPPKSRVPRSRFSFASSPSPFSELNRRGDAPPAHLDRHRKPPSGEAPATAGRTPSQWLFRSLSLSLSSQEMGKEEVRGSVEPLFFSFGLRVETRTELSRVSCCEDDQWARGCCCPHPLLSVSGQWALCPPHPSLALASGPEVTLPSAAWASSHSPLSASLWTGKWARRPPPPHIII